MNRVSQADVIKVAAVITAMPRWVGALMAAEGLIMPEDWLSWWVWLSLFLNASMAIVEGLAFSYVFNSWRNQKDKRANKLLWLAGASAIVFVLVLAPFIAAQVRRAPLADVLGKSWGLWLWSGSVAASTIVIVASVGYAQKEAKTTKSTVKEQVPAWKLENTCWCDWQPVSEKNIEYRVIAHSRKHVNEMKSSKYTTAIDAWEGMKRKYPEAFANGNEPVTIAEIAQVREG